MGNGSDPCYVLVPVKYNGISNLLLQLINKVVDDAQSDYAVSSLGMGFASGTERSSFC